MLQRGIIYRDGRSAAIFSVADSPVVIAFEPSGERFTYMGPQGESQKQLTVCALTKLIPLVDAALRFRNTFCAAPYVPQSIFEYNPDAEEPSSTDPVDTYVDPRVAETRLPAPALIAWPQKWEPEHCSESATGWKVRSLDHLHVLSVAKHFMYAEVSTLVPIIQDAKESEDVAARIQQRVSVDPAHAPARYAAALQVILDHVEPSVTAVTSGVLSVRWHPAPEPTAGWTFSEEHLRGLLQLGAVTPPSPDVLLDADATKDLEDMDRSVRETKDAIGLTVAPFGEDVLVDWTPFALYQVLPVPAVPGAALLMSHDGAPGFIELFEAGQDRWRLFALTALPARSRDTKSSAADLHLTVQHMLRLADALPRPEAAIAAKPAVTTTRSAPVKTVIATKKYVHGWGDFESKADGSVRVHFTDDTLLYMAPDLTCELVLSNGQTVMASLTRRSLFAHLECAVYLDATVEFLEWLKQGRQ